MRYFCRIRELRVNSLPPRIKIYFIYFSSIFCKGYIGCAISDSIWDIFRPFGHFWVSEGKTSKNIYHFNVLNLFLQAQKWWIISLFSILWLIFGHFINPFLNYFFLGSMLPQYTALYVRVCVCRKKSHFQGGTARRREASYDVARLLLMAPIDPWRNSTPDFGAVAFCTTNIEDFRTSLTSSSSTISSTYSSQKRS